MDKCVICVGDNSEDLNVVSSLGFTALLEYAKILADSGDERLQSFLQIEYKKKLVSRFIVGARKIYTEPKEKLCHRS